MTQAPPGSIGRGVGLALASAVAFGVTAPIVAWAGAAPLTAAALLYAGAALAAFAMRPFAARAGARLGRAEALTVVAIAVIGAAIAPALLAFGLGRAGATAGSLALNLEAPLTVGLAWLVWREPIGRRVLLAGAAMVTGGALVAFDAGRSSVGLIGVIAVGGATLAWALDNTLSRRLAECDPLDVVGAKATLGATLAMIVGRALGEPLPELGRIAALMACGATGYGVSLRLYLLAQRRIGAARTASVFAVAPFLGAAIGWAAGSGDPGMLTAIGAAGFALGVWLHVTEHHEHDHVHEAVAHEHAHRHDDGHHDHTHEPPVRGEHSHAHQHARVVHAHAHAPDVHHGHAH
ncbi:MAG: DMT family transporter [Deltaproteobacteria bacterium]|nr:DMT family transporter [Deltaproteobacteria bacterium]